MLLNGEIEPDKAQAYAGLSRVTAQALSSEITRARFVKEEPNMSLEGNVFEDDDA